MECHRWGLQTPGNQLPGSQEVVGSSVWADSLAWLTFALENVQWLPRKKKNTFYRPLTWPPGFKFQDRKTRTLQDPLDTFTFIYERDIKLWMHLILRKRNCRRLVNLPGLPQWPPSTLCLTAHDNSPWTYQLLHMYTRVGKLKILS